VLHYFRKVPDGFSIKDPYLSVADSRYEVKIRVQALPRREGPALIILRGDLVCRHLTICGVLEYWSGGVMEETPFFIVFRERIPKENLKV